MGVGTPFEPVLPLTSLGFPSFRSHPDPGSQPWLHTGASFKTIPMPTQHLKQNLCISVFAKSFPGDSIVHPGCISGETEKALAPDGHGLQQKWLYALLGPSCSA